MSDKRTEFGQYAGTGEHDPADHAKNVEEEAVAHGTPINFDNTIQQQKPMATPEVK